MTVAALTTLTPLAPLAQGAAGLAVAASFALLLATKRVRSAALLCAGQAALVAVAALSQSKAGVAVVELTEAAALAWAASETGSAGVAKALGFDHVLSPASRIPMAAMVPVTVLLAIAAVLAALAAPIPTIGLALAVILLGLLLLLDPAPGQKMLGVVAMQNGLVLAAVSVGLSGGRLIPVVVPVLPTAAIVAVWLGADRRKIGWLIAPPIAAWIDAALCGLALLAACALPWALGRYHSSWLLDARAAQIILLLCALSAAAAWAARDTTPVWGSRLAVLAGSILAVLSCAPLVTWLGMALATIAAASAALPRRAEAWRRLVLGCAGLTLALFGTVGEHAASTALPAAGCFVLGYGMLAVLAPELTIAAAALILRVRGAGSDDLLMTMGLTGLVVAAIGLAGTRLRQRRLLPLVDLAQGGVAVFAFGLGTTGGNLAGLLQLSFLALTRCAWLLSRPDGLDRLAALAGLAGMPPTGLFASLALILAATASRSSWLLLPLGAGLSAVAWALLSRLPAGRRLLPSPAWLPLLLLLLCSFAMPAPLLAWFRLAAR